MYRGADKSLARPGRKRLTGHLQPRRNWPTWASNALIEKEVGRAKDLSASGIAADGNLAAASGD
jgi:hypothetical protein